MSGATRDCPDPDAILGLAEHSLEEPGAPDLIGHILSCPRCLAVYAETRALGGLAHEVPAAIGVGVIVGERPRHPVEVGINPEQRRPPGFAWPTVSLGFAAGVAAACALAFFAVYEPLRSQVGSLTAEAAKERAVNEKFAGQAEQYANRLKTAEAALRAQAGQTNKPEPENGAAGLLERVVLSGRFELPAEILSFVAASREQGPGEDNVALRLQDPVDTCIENRQPVLAAAPDKNATSPKIVVIDLDGNEVPVKRVSDWSWRPAAPLKPGTVYQWSVEARLSGRTVVSPVASIRVLSATEAARFAEQRELYAKQPLLLAAIYARAGLLDEAETALKYALKEHPGHSLAQGLLRDLRSTRKGGR